YPRTPPAASRLPPWPLAAWAEGGTPPAPVAALFAGAPARPAPALASRTAGRTRYAAFAPAPRSWCHGFGPAPAPDRPAPEIRPAAQEQNGSWHLRATSLSS